MQRIKKVITCFLTVIVLLSVAGSANAMKSSDYPVEIHVMTAEERNAFESQTEATPIVGTAFLSPNNEAGTNGSICAPFTAETANMAFVVKSAPGALNYNVQLYAGVPGAGERASNYATIEVNNGVYFSGLTVGQYGSGLASCHSSPYSDLPLRRSVGDVVIASYSLGVV